MGSALETLARAEVTSCTSQLRGVGLPEHWRHQQGEHKVRHIQGEAEFL